MDINMIYSKVLLSRYIKAIEKKGWMNHSKMPTKNEKQMVYFSVTDGSNDSNCFQFLFVSALKPEDNHCILFLQRKDSIIDDKAIRDKIVKFLSYANRGMIIGNFEINQDNGEVRYKVSLPAGKSCGFFYAIPSRKALAHIIDVALATAIRYNEGIDKLLKDDTQDPKQVCDSIDGVPSEKFRELVRDSSELTDEKKEQFLQLFQSR